MSPSNQIAKAGIAVCISIFTGIVCADEPGAPSSTQLPHKVHSRKMLDQAPNPDKDASDAEGAAAAASASRSHPHTHTRKAAIRPSSEAVD